MAKQKIMKIGNSICVTVPAHFVQSVGITVGEQVEVKTTPEKARVIYQFSGSRQLTLTNSLLKKKRRKRARQK